MTGGAARGFTGFRPDAGELAADELAAERERWRAVGRATTRAGATRTFDSRTP